MENPVPRGHGNAVSLPGLIVGTPGTRGVLTMGNINSDATGFDRIPKIAIYHPIGRLKRMILEICPIDYFCITLVISARKAQF
ncbi:MAG: hypothetical protein HC789_17680 [Microcoleus sp. CSU_2_2]|nr:hypothetical protein [Microcoleus sp. CSU_2_2]